MSPVEDQLKQAIATVTGDLVVTESDLLEARAEIRERVEGDRRRNRIRLIALTAAAASAVGILGATGALTPGGDEQAEQVAAPQPLPDPLAKYFIGEKPTQALVQGIWRLDNGDVMVRFGRDRSIDFDDQGTIFSKPGTRGTYAIEGDRLVVTITTSTTAACVGRQFALRASVPEVGRLRFVREADLPACTPLPEGTRALEQLIPTNAVAGDLSYTREPGWKPLTASSRLPGVWLAEGGGHLLELDRDGAYFVADASGLPIDRGTWSLADTDLTLASSALSSQCAVGDSWVLSSAEIIASGAQSFRGSVTRNDCGGRWTPASWILVPDASS